MDAWKLSRIGNVYYVEELSWRYPVFRDRRHAGRLLGSLLSSLPEKPVAVYALAAGGIPVALEAAEALGACMDVVVVKKITYPWTTEAGYGAVAPDGGYEYDRRVHDLLGYTLEEVRKQAAMVHRYVVERTLRLRGSLEYKPPNGLVAVVDDGIATGYTMLVALGFLERVGARKLLAAAPTASVDGAMMVSEKAPVYVLNLRRGPYYAVADAYVEWHDVSDEEAKSLLEEARRKGLLCQP